jgi:fumarate hydratase subunit alpha
MSTLQHDNLIEQITQKTERSILDAGVLLPEDVKQAIERASTDPGLSKEGALVLSHILKNLEVAEQTRLPMCQDTGMVVAFIDIGSGSRVHPPSVEQAVIRGVRQAYELGNFRKSIVADPVFSRNNTGDNLPIMTHLHIMDGEQTDISIMLKGFGSENCSCLAMLNPTEGPDGVIQAAADCMRRAGGKPCPPVIIGMGIGGTAEQALLLSKRALLRDVGVPNRSRAYAELEQMILERVNSLGIGPGGLGGAVTALGVSIETAATHIAGMPVGISISCWADRKAFFSLDKDGRFL